MENTLISIVQFSELLAGITGATFATLTTRTDAKARKTGNPFGVIFKRNTVNVCLNMVYGNAVNRQRVREGNEADFVPQPRKWGNRIAGTTVVEHKGKLYVEAKVESAGKPTFEQADGTPLTFEQVSAFLPESKSSAEHQGVEKEIYLRDYSFESILGIAINGEKYQIDHAAPVAVAV